MYAGVGTTIKENRMSAIGIALCVVALNAVPASAQGRGALLGVVVEPSTGLPVPNAEVRVLGTDQMARSDTLGGFRFALDPGKYLLRATRLGFGPRSVSTNIVAGDTVTMSIEMDVLPFQLAEVTVKAREERYRGKMAGFAQRMRTSAASRSSFITRDEIERRHPLRISDFIKERGWRAGTCGEGDDLRGRRHARTGRDRQPDPRAAD
jgi:hypothetical protein